MAHNPIKSLAGQTAVYGMGTIIPRLLNYLLVPFYTRVFSQHEYGQVTELYAYVAFLLVLLTYGMETAFFRYAQKEGGRRVFNTAWSAVMLSSAIFIALMAFLFPSAAHAIGYQSETSFVLLIALIVALDATTAIPFALLRQQNKARLFALIKIANVTLNISLNVFFLLLIPEKSVAWAEAMLGPGTSLVVWVFVSNLAASLFALLLLLPHIGGFRFSCDFALFKPMLRYALPVLVVGLAGMTNEVIDKLLLKHLLPDSDGALAQVGIYGANFKLAVLMTLFIQMFRYAAEPFFFANADKKESPELFARVMNYFVIFGLSIFLMVTLFIDYFKLFIGESFHDGLSIVPIVLMANLFYGIFFNLSVWYKLTDRTRYGAIISLIGAAITVLLNIILIPVWGYYGSAWAHFVCYFMMMVISYAWGKRFYKIPYTLKTLAAYAALAMLLYALSAYTHNLSATLKALIHSFMLIGFFGGTMAMEMHKEKKQNQ